MAKVYGTYNYTKRERYYGSTKREVKKERVPEHKAGQTQAIKHWNWKKDKIVTRTIAKGLPPGRATQKAHELESRKPPSGWKN
ncbi:unnamed protein product, partial [marine sediment metagenome]